MGWGPDADEWETSGHHWLHVWIDKGTTGRELYQGFRRAGAPCTDARVVWEPAGEEAEGVGALAFRQVGPVNVHVIVIVVSIIISIVVVSVLISVISKCKSKLSCTSATILLNKVHDNGTTELSRWLAPVQNNDKKYDDASSL